MHHPLVARIDQLSTDRWARRSLRTLLRALWLGLCVACVGLAGHLLWGWPLRLDLLAGLVLACVGVGAIALLRPRLEPRVAARRLDRRFGLNEQLSTALEVAPAQPAPDSVPGRLLAEAAHTTAHLRRYIGARQRPPWVEIATTLSLALVLIGMLVLLGMRGAGYNTTPLPLPDLAGPLSEQSPPNEPPVPQQGAQPGAQPGAQGDSQSQGAQGEQGSQAGQGGQGSQPDAGVQRALDAIADALRDQSATRPAADALDRGDTAGAASSLRELADQAAQLGDQTRGDIAQALRDAARNVQQSDPGLAGQLRDSADGLERGGSAAADALDGLARAVEQQGQGQQNGQNGQGGQGQGQSGQGNAPGGEQRDQPSGRLNAPGVPLELENQGQGTVPAQGNRPPNATVSGAGSGFTPSGEARDSGMVQAGDDPLRIPAEDRDVVQGYFSPQE